MPPEVLQSLVAADVERCEVLEGGLRRLLGHEPGPRVDPAGGLAVPHDAPALSEIDPRGGLVEP